jgi:hypothetical protein
MRNRPHDADARQRAPDQEPGEPVLSPRAAVWITDVLSDPAARTLPLRAASGDDIGSIEWTVDGRPVGASHGHRSLEWPLAPGAHRIAARTGRWKVASVDILVK